ncbi:N-acetyltransferase family protein [Caenispirillum bisanense]|uniref:GNAT family N-acetyltransferase n=1 Tax=Caenispirillum bisanense TaxID=414052 RepID=UPI0031D4FEB0
MPPSPIVLRPATAADMAQVQAIYAHHVLTGIASFETEPPTVAEMERRRADIAGRGLPYLVATDGAGGPVVGYAYAGLYRPRPAYRHTVEDSVYVAPGQGRRGIGRDLLAAVIARCEALGLRQMIAVIGDSGNAGSIGLHESLGFRRVGLLPSVGFKFGRWVDSVLMQRPLGDGDGSLPAD